MILKNLNNPKTNLKKIILTALFTAIIAVCAQIVIPSPVPFTMQTFGVFCALKILGAKAGTVSILVYIAAGAAGLPVFSAFSAGAGVLFGPTGGYIWGFALIGVVYIIFSPFCKTDKGRNALLAAGLALCYLLGTVMFSYVSASRGNPVSFSQGLLVCVVPYVLPDAAKLFLADVISKRVSKFM